MNVEFDMTPPCTECGQKYPIVDSDDGLPVMVGFVTQDEVVNVCKYCLINIGIKTVIGGDNDETDEYQSH